MTIETVSGSVLNGFDREAARRRADRIRTAAEELWDTIAVAYQQRDWLALGYGSWDEYCQREFGSLRIRIPREERAEIVSSLRDSGLSLRAIEAATGLSTATSRRALAGVSNVTPDSEPSKPDRIDYGTGEVLTDDTPEDRLDAAMDALAEIMQANPNTSAAVGGGEAPAAAEPPKVTGLNGKVRFSRRLDTTDRDNEIVERRRRGQTIREIADGVGCSVGTVHRILTNHLG